MKVIPRPKKKDYCEPATLMNAICDTDYVLFDKDAYIKQMEKYVNYLEELVKKLEL